MDNQVDQRINRLVGQIEGIRRMIHAKRDCSDVAQQVLAARQALSRIGLLVLKDGICKTPVKNKKKVEDLLARVFRI